MRNASAVDSSASEEVHFPCVSSWAFCVFPSIQNRTKKASLFPWSTAVCAGAISCILFFFQLRCLGFLRENGLVVCWGPVSNGRMMIFKMSFRQSKSPDFQHGHMWKTEIFFPPITTSKWSRKPKSNFFTVRHRIHQSPGTGVIWAISSFFRGGFTEVSSRVDFIQINQSLAAEGTADPPGGVTFWVPESGWDEPLKLF